MKKIFIVEDDKSICMELVEILENEGYAASYLTDFEHSKEEILAAGADLILMDINIPGINGRNLLKEIRKESDIPVIMVTSRTSEMDEVLSMSYGADDYITKPFQPLELLARVKGQLRRAKQYNQAAGVTQTGDHATTSEPGESEAENSGEIYDIRGLEVNVNTHTCSLYGENLEFTPIEFEILRYLCQHLNEAVTSEELFESVWKEKYYDSNNTVFVHISRIREKMHENSRKPKFIKTVWGIGYKLEE